MTEYWFDFVGSFVKCFAVDGIGNVMNSELNPVIFDKENKLYLVNFDGKEFKFNKQ